MVWRKLPFILLLLITVAVLATATVVEKLYGTPFVQEHWYGSPLFTILWVLLSCAGLLYILRAKLYRRFWIWMIHVSLLVILLGAGLTSWTAIHGRIKLQEGATPTDRYQSDQGETLTLPFEVALERFDLTYYTGTQFPLDYQSNLLIQDQERSQSLRGAVSMNRIFRYRFYRFYQSGYDPETTSSILSIAYDPWGIAISYLGYALLAISLVGGMFARRHRVRQLLKQALVSPVAMLLILLAGGTLSAEAKAPATPLPKTVPANVAKSLGELHILYNNRVCPLGTYAQEFTEKLYGRSSYRGLSAEQVLAGWIFYYDNWVDEPMIRIKDRSIRKLLECYEGQRVSYRQFFDLQGNYRLESLLDNYIQHPDQPGRKALFEAHEKCQVIQSLGLGESLAIFPVQSHGRIAWYHPASTDLPAEMPLDQWTFVRKGFNYLSELIIMQQWDEAQEFLVKLRQYQLKEGGESCPSALRFRSEIYYNHLSPYIGLLAKILATVGILLFIWTAYQLSVGRLQDPPLVKWCFWGILYASMLYLTLMVILRWIVSGYVPLSNGFETMQALAWIVLLLTILTGRKHRVLIPFGLLMGGLSLLVASFGGSNPQITPLMPVLHSPLLSIHVLVIMIAYSLLAFMMLNSCMALILSRRPAIGTHLEALSRLLLYPAVALLAIGIFIGAVWANVSWGRYWSWDPKEVWALITLIIYALPLHCESLRCFRSQRFLHVYLLIAFVSVLVTYFGVNFFQTSPSAPCASSFLQSQDNLASKIVRLLTFATVSSYEAINPLHGGKTNSSVEIFFPHASAVPPSGEQIFIYHDP